MQEKHQNNTLFNLLAVHEKKLFGLRKSIQSVDETNCSQYMQSYQDILTSCRSIQSENPTVVSRLNLILAECYTQIVRCTQEASSSVNVSEAESTLDSYKQLFEKAIKNTDSITNKAPAALDYLKGQWAGNLWTIGLMYCKNVLPKFVDRPQEFDEKLLIAKKYLEEAAGYYSSIVDEKKRKEAQLFLGGSVLGIANQYKALADNLCEVAEEILGAGTLQFKLSLLDKALALYQQAVSNLGPIIKNKTHTEILLKICHAYNDQLPLLTKDQSSRLHSQIIFHASKVENQNKVAHSITWDHHILARCYLFKSYLYLFEQEQNHSSSNKYGKKLVNFAKGFLDYYEYYGNSIKNQKDSFTILENLADANEVLSKYKRTSFVDSIEEVKQSPSPSSNRAFLEDDVDADVKSSPVPRKFKRLRKLGETNNKGHTQSDFFSTFEFNSKLAKLGNDKAMGYTTTDKDSNSECSFSGCSL